MLSAVNLSPATLKLEAHGDLTVDSTRPQDNLTRLCSTEPVVINGCLMHCHFFQVDDDGNAVNVGFEEEVGAIAVLTAGKPDTTTIDGRKYVVGIFPHED